MNQTISEWLKAAPGERVITSYPSKPWSMETRLDS